MNEHEISTESRVSVTFKRSSTKDGGEGYDIYVGEGAPEAEAIRVLALAASLRDKARVAIGLETAQEQLDRLLDAAMDTSLVYP